jgi:predicted nucleic acid-binding protein
VLGYYRITIEDKEYFEALFRQLQILPVTDEIISIATDIRQKNKFSLGDAIIAATALLYKATILTRNTTDFIKIKELKVINPI